MHPFCTPWKHQKTFLSLPQENIRKPSFLYPMKTLENLTVFWYFQGEEKGCIGNEWVKNKDLLLMPFMKFSIIFRTSIFQITLERVVHCSFSWYTLRMYDVSTTKFCEASFRHPDDCYALPSHNLQATRHTKDIHLIFCILWAIFSVFSWEIPLQLGCYF